MEFNTFYDFAKEMRRRAEDLRPAFREGTREATDILHVEAKKQLNETIYSIPETTGGFSFKKTGRGTADEAFKLKKSGKRARSSTGRKKWTRTGNLRRSETRGMANDYEGFVQNDASYARPRHDLGLPAGHPDAIRGSRRKSTRIAPWRVRAIRNTEEARRQAFRNAFWNVLSR